MARSTQVTLQEAENAHLVVGAADYEARVLMFLERHLDGSGHQSGAHGRLYTGANFSPAGS